MADDISRYEDDSGGRCGCGAGYGIGDRMVLELQADLQDIEGRYAETIRLDLAFAQLQTSAMP